MYCVILCDLNVPNGKLREHLRHFAQVTKAISDINPSRTVCVCTFPDLPSDSSAKGLDDEEAKIKAEFADCGFAHDCRFIINLKPSALARCENLPAAPRAWCTVLHVEPFSANLIF